MSSSFNSFNVETKDLKGEISPTSALLQVAYGRMDKAQHDETTRQIEKRLAEISKLLEQISTLNGEIDSLRQQL